MQKSLFFTILLLVSYLLLSCKESVLFEQDSAIQRKIYFSNASPVVAGSSVIVGVVVKDQFGDLDETANGKVRLALTGNAAAGGLVEISKGRGNASVVDTTAESVVVSLDTSDIENLTLGGSGSAAFYSGSAFLVGFVVETFLATGVRETLLVQSQDKYGNKVTTINNKEVALTCTSDSGDCEFYASEVIATTTNKVTLVNGEGRIFIRDITSEIGTIKVDAVNTNLLSPGLCGASPSLDCTDERKVYFGTGVASGLKIDANGSTELQVGDCEKLTIQAVNSGDVAIPFPETSIVSLTTTANEDSFYSDIGCTFETDLINIAAGSTGTDIYYKANNIETLTLKAVSLGLTTKPLVINAIDDDPIISIDDGEAITSTSESPTITWTTNHPYGTFTYKVTVKRFSDGVIMSGPISVGSSQSKKVTGLSLTSNEKYYVTIEAKDFNNHISTTVKDSNGWVVDSAAPTVIVSAPSVADTHVGPVMFTITLADNSNSFTFNKTLLESGTTVTTTGNATGTLSYTYSNTLTDITQSDTAPTVTATISDISGFGMLGISVPAGVLTDRVSLSSVLATSASSVNVSQSNEIVLDSSPSVAGDEFGGTIDMYGSTIVVSASNYNNGDGRIFIYRIGDLGNPKMVNGESNNRSFFGKRVAIDNGNIVVAAIGDDTNGEDAGAVYVLSYDSDTAAWVKGTAITPDDGKEGDLFGSSIAISGDVLVVGAQGDDDDTAGRSSGAAYVFRWNGDEWLQEAKLVASDKSEWASFGNSVATSGDVIVVGSSGSSQSTGAAYIFRKSDTTWAQKKKLTYEDAKAGDLFGSSVAISGNVVVVGAPKVDVDGADGCGSSFIYTYSGSSWDSGQQLTPQTCSDNLNFGSTVDNDDSVIIVGATGYGTTSGASYAYYFEQGRWQTSIERLITPQSGNNAGNKFGSDVAISGNLAVIASKFGDSGTIDGGAVYLYDGVHSNASHVLTSTNSTEGFGKSVSISRSIAAVGAPSNSDNGDDSGVAYLYVRDGNSWVKTKVVSTDIAEDDQFGYAVSAYGDMVAIGAPYNDDSGTGSGSVYVFKYDAENEEWKQLTKLSSPSARENELFGSSVSLYMDKLLVGAKGSDSSKGVAYLYSYVNGVWQATPTTLIPTDHEAGDEFGASVSLADDMMIIGAPKNDYNSIVDAGAAYIYRNHNGTWSYQRKMHSTLNANTNFGKVVSISGNIAVVGHANGSNVYYYDGDDNWVHSASLSYGDSVSNFGGMVLTGSSSSYAVHSCDVTGCSALPSQAITATNGYGKIEVRDNIMIMGERSSDEENVYISPIRLQ